MNLFSNDSLLGQSLSFLGHLILLNILWMICSLPVITIGASTTALYYSVLKLHKYHDISPLKDFFKSFRQNFLQSTMAWFVLLMIGILLYAEGRWLFLTSTSQPLILTFSLAVVGLIWTELAIYLFPVIAAFENSLGKLVGHALFFAFKKAHYQIAVVAITILPMYFTLVDAKLFPIYLFIWLMIGFALTAYVNSWFFLKLFTPYLPSSSEDGAKDES